MAINISDFNKIWASTSPLTPYSFSDANYKNGWNFVGATPPARQMWDSYMKASDEKHQWLYNNKLSLSGGTMTGGLTASSIAFIPSFSPNIYVNQDYSDLKMYGGTAVHKGGDLQLFGKDSSLLPGYFRLAADDGTNRKQLIGTPGGSLTWDNNDIALVKDVLTLSGGTMTGLIRFDSSMGRIQKTNNTGGMLVAGSNSVDNGAYLSLYGGGASNYAGYFYLTAQDGTNSVSLTGKPDGTLTWGGQPIQTSSDKRLKQSFSDVPASVLEAWGKVEWKRFKYKADAERKGAKNCRWHTGLVAQDVQKVGEENNVDLLKYGILCHDVQDAVEEVKDEDGNVVTEARDAVDLWTIRYEEALAMEVIYLRNEIKKLRDEIKASKEK